MLRVTASTVFFLSSLLVPSLGDCQTIHGPSKFYSVQGAPAPEFPQSKVEPQATPGLWEKEYPIDIFPATPPPSITICAQDFSAHLIEVGNALPPESVRAKAISGNDLVVGEYQNNGKFYPFAWHPSAGEDLGVLWNHCQASITECQGANAQAKAIGVADDGKILLELSPNGTFDPADLLLYLVDYPDFTDAPVKYLMMDLDGDEIEDPNNTGVYVGPTTSVSGNAVFVAGRVGPPNPQTPSVIPDYDLCGGDYSPGPLPKMTIWHTGAPVLVQNGDFLEDLGSPYGDPYGWEDPYGNDLYQIYLTLCGISPTHQLHPQGLSSNGHIVGYMTQDQTLGWEYFYDRPSLLPATRVPFKYTPGVGATVLTELGELPGEAYCSGPLAVNNDGTVVGCFLDDDDRIAAFYWQVGSATPATIGHLDEANANSYSVALDISHSGCAIGVGLRDFNDSTCEVAECPRGAPDTQGPVGGGEVDKVDARAIIYDNLSSVSNLNCLVTDLSHLSLDEGHTLILTEAHLINDRGSIVSLGHTACNPDSPANPTQREYFLEGEFTTVTPTPADWFPTAVPALP